MEKQLFEEVRVNAGVIVDLTDVSFIDSSGIGLLIRALRSTEDAGAVHTVIAEGSQVDRVFSLAGIDRVAADLHRTRARARGPERGSGLLDGGD